MNNEIILIDEASIPYAAHKSKPIEPDTMNNMVRMIRHNHLNPCLWVEGNYEQR